MIPPGYTVTREGRVKGRSGRWLKPSLVSGQMSVCFMVDGVQRRFYVGRLVCEEFHGPPPTPDHVAEHIDRDPSNNHADNLRWATREEVGREQTGEERPYLQGEKHHQAVLTWEKVRSIRQEYARTHTTKTHLARQYGVSDTTIHYIIINKNWTDPAYAPPPPRRKKAPRGQ